MSENLEELYYKTQIYKITNIINNKPYVGQTSLARKNMKIKCQIKIATQSNCGKPLKLNITTPHSKECLSLLSRGTTFNNVQQE